MRKIFFVSFFFMILSIFFSPKVFGQGTMFTPCINDSDCGYPLVCRANPNKPGEKACQDRFTVVSTISPSPASSIGGPCQDQLDCIFPLQCRNIDPVTKVGKCEDSAQRLVDPQSEQAIPGVNCGVAPNLSLGPGGAPDPNLATPNPNRNKCCVSSVPPSMEDWVNNRIPDFGCLILGSFCVSSIFKTPIRWVFGWGPFANIIDLRKRPVNQCIYGDPVGSGSACTCVARPFNSRELCDAYLKSSTDYAKCAKCAAESPGAVWTGIGCIYINRSEFVQKTLFGFGIGLAGGIALLCIIYSAYTLQTAGGNPEKIKKAQERLTSCIIGLMLIIFSAFILRVIGVDILRIPGFGP